LDFSPTIQKNHETFDRDSVWIAFGLPRAPKRTEERETMERVVEEESREDS
jgi:hypothetical protein